MKTTDALRVGLRFGKDSRYSTLRFWFLGLASTATILSIFLLTVTIATYSEREARSEQRSINFADVDPTAGPSTYRHAFLNLAVGNYLEVNGLYLEPLTSDAPLPPGLNQWPEPGTIFISPALANFVESDKLSERFGTVAGYIGTEGLTDPGELLIYARPQPGILTDENSNVGTAFAGGYAFGRTAYDKPLNTFLQVQSFLTIVPALLLLLTASKLGAGARSRRNVILERIGITPRKLHFVLLSEAIRPLAVGSGIAAAVASAFFLTDVTLPFTGFTVQAHDVREHSRLAITMFLVAIVLSCLIAIWGGRAVAEQRSTRIKVHPISYLGAAAAPAIALTLVTLQNLNYAGVFFKIDDSTMGIIYVLGIALVLVLLPTASSQWIRITSKVLRRYAWRHGKGGLLVGSRQIAAKPRPASRFATVTILMIVTLSITYAYITMFSEGARDALQFQADTGERVAELTISGAQVQQSEFTENLPPGYDAILLRQESSDGLTSQLLIYGSPHALATFSLPEGEFADQQLAANAATRIQSQWLHYLAAASSYEATITATSQPLPPIVENPNDAPLYADFVLISPRDGSKIDLPELNAELAAAFPEYFIEADFPGEDWLIGTMVSEQHANWLWLFGMAATALIIAGLWANYANELLRAQRQLGPIQVLAPNGRFVMSAIATRILIPVAVAIIGGCAIAVILTAPQTIIETESFEVNYGPIFSLATVAAISAVIGWAITSRSAINHAEQLTLGAPDE